MNKISADHLAGGLVCIFDRRRPVRSRSESQRLQYALIDRAQQLGWAEVDVVDEILGFTASGVRRPGFERMLGSVGEGKIGATARRLHLWLCQQQIQLPTVVRGVGTSRAISWSAPRYHSLLSWLKNPIYAGVFAYGRSRGTVRLEQGRKRIVRRKHQREEWVPRGLYQLGGV